MSEAINFKRADIGRAGMRVLGEASVERVVFVQDASVAAMITLVVAWGVGLCSLDSGRAGSSDNSIYAQERGNRARWLPVSVEEEGKVQGCINCHRSKRDNDFIRTSSLR